MQDTELTLFVGDIHSDFESFEMLARFMLYRVPGISRIVQVGDFGFWPTQPSWLWYPKSTLPVPVQFIDGNHEDHVALTQAEQDIPATVSEHYDAQYIPRGYVADGYLYCGGATSYDRAYRTEGLDWFEGENITDEQIRRGMDNAIGKSVRIMVAHETVREAFHSIRRASWVVADQNRERLEELFHAVRPEIYIHGHYHFYSDYEYADCRFICLQNPDHFKHELEQTEQLRRIEGYSGRVEDAFMHVAQRCCVVTNAQEGVIGFR